MKNAAKCGAWCELQNPANHRVFERKLRPGPSGPGHACLSVNSWDAPLPRAAMCWWGAGCGHWTPAPHPPSALGSEEHASDAAEHGGWWMRLRCGRRESVRLLGIWGCPSLPAPRKDPWPSGQGGAPWIATSGQVWSPAELKHINKRRRRNLRGFP